MPVGEALFAHPGLPEYLARHRSLPVRWVPRQNLHVTLVPPWNCDNPDTVCAALHELLADTASIDVRFTSVSIGPTARKPRLIWASGGACRELGELRESVSHLGVPDNENDREFLPHITLARMRKGKALFLEPEPVDWRVTLGSVSLYESILHSSGAEYRILCDVGLTPL